MKRYTQLEHLQVKPNPKKAASPQVAVQAEGEKVLKLIMPQVKSSSIIMSLLAHCSQESAWDTNVDVHSLS